jgi:hypothetical protein
LRDWAWNAEAALTESRERVERLREALGDCWGEAYLGLLAPDSGAEEPPSLPQHMGRALDNVITVARNALSTPDSEDATGEQRNDMMRQRLRAERCPTCGLTVKIPASKGSHGCSDPWHEESE